MNENTLRKKLRYDEIIKKYNKFNIEIPNRKATDIMNNPIISNLLSLDTSVIDINEKTLMLDKETQKYDTLHNYDLFPDMYHIIDAEASKHKNNYYKLKTDMMTQTIRYILKDMPTPYSSVSSPSSKGKPPSSPPDGSIHKPTPTPTPAQSVKSKEPTPTPSQRSPTPPTPVSSRILTPVKKGNSSNPSASSSSLSIDELVPQDGIMTLAPPILSHTNSIHTPTNSPPISINTSPPLSINTSPPISVSSRTSSRTKSSKSSRSI